MWVSDSFMINVEIVLYWDCFVVEVVNNIIEVGSERVFCVWVINNGDELFMNIEVKVFVSDLFSSGNDEGIISEFLLGEFEEFMIVLSVGVNVLLKCYLVLFDF